MIYASICFVIKILIRKVNESWYHCWCVVFIYCYLQNHCYDDSNDEKRSGRKKLDDHSSIFDSTCLVAKVLFFCLYVVFMLSFTMYRENTAFFLASSLVSPILLLVFQLFYLISTQFLCNGICQDKSFVEVLSIFHKDHSFLTNIFFISRLYVVFMLSLCCCGQSFFESTKKMNWFTILIITILIGILLSCLCFSVSNVAESKHPLSNMIRLASKYNQAKNN